MRNFLFISVILILASSCSPKLVPFTQDLREKVEENELDLTRVQYYNSDEIQLQNMDPKEALEIEKGEITLKKEKNVNEIVFREETPGKCLSIIGDQFDITFEGGEKFLSFRLRGKSPESTFVVVTEETDKGFSKVLYDEKDFAILPEGEFSELLVSKKLVNSLNKKKRYAKGVRVD